MFAPGLKEFLGCDPLALLAWQHIIHPVICRGLGCKKLGSKK